MAKAKPTKKEEKSFGDIFQDAKGLAIMAMFVGMVEILIWRHFDRQYLEVESNQGPIDFFKIALVALFFFSSVFAFAQLIESLFVKKNRRRQLYNVGVRFEVCGVSLLFFYWFY